MLHIISEDSLTSFPVDSFVPVPVRLFNLIYSLEAKALFLLRISGILVLCLKFAQFGMDLFPALHHDMFNSRKLNQICPHNVSKQVGTSSSLQYSGLQSSSSTASLSSTKSFNVLHTKSFNLHPPRISFLQSSSASLHQAQPFCTKVMILVRRIWRRRHSLLENCFGVVISLGWDYLMSCYLLAAAAWINVNMPGTDTAAACSAMNHMCRGLCTQVELATFDSNYVLQQPLMLVVPNNQDVSTPLELMY
ncbi:hypothetical protein KIW84_075098 [Lathyrus oleraceus]|uniref:Uncharacterized protein n=1 Tax=Pisum sativum TaxID=3888 RepID=A0A9D4VT36_PEA|nr:hypothetical protein KIW84_075098 [Pisum sativum]